MILVSNINYISEIKIMKEMILKASPTLRTYGLCTAFSKKE